MAYPRGDPADTAPFAGPDLRAGFSSPYAGTTPVNVNVIGDGERPWWDGERPWWDAILVVEYPSPAAFTAMVADSGYQRVHEHRAAALLKGDLVATSRWVMG